MDKMLVTPIPWTRTLSWLFRNPSDPLTNSKNITSVQQTCTGHHNNVSQGVITDTDQSGQPLESLRRFERSIYRESQFQTEWRGERETKCIWSSEGLSVATNVPRLSSPGHGADPPFLLSDPEDKTL